SAVERLMLVFVAFAPGPSAAIAKVDTAIKAAAVNVFTKVFIMSLFYCVSSVVELQLKSGDFLCC
ncbi:MAG TPA: hypothetical protein DCP78_19295, partial [Sphingobacterium sp.]|nr:hypothetical protein [Sphingobacterium sp.]